MIPSAIIYQNMTVINLSGPTNSTSKYRAWNVLEIKKVDYYTFFSRAL